MPLCPKVNQRDMCLQWLPVFFFFPFTCPFTLNFFRFCLLIFSAYLPSCCTEAPTTPSDCMFSWLFFFLSVIPVELDLHRPCLLICLGLYRMMWSCHFYCATPVPKISPSMEETAVYDSDFTLCIFLRALLLVRATKGPIWAAFFSTCTQKPLLVLGKP